MDKGVNYEDDDYEPEYNDDDEGPQFADPTGRSALRAETPFNPRNIPCPSCGAPNRLTAEDVALGYQCDYCADKAERGLAWDD